MHFTAETTADGVCERTFVLGDIHGIPGDITASPAASKASSGYRRVPGPPVR